MQEEAARYYHHFFPLLDLGLGDNPERGRHVIARRSFPSGSLLFEEDPFAVAAREGCTSTHCNHCCRPLISEPDIIACDDCAAAWYCSAGCARLDRECGWHRKECAANKDLAPRSLAVYARLVLRMLGRKQTEVNNSPPRFSFSYLGLILLNLHRICLFRSRECSFSLPIENMTPSQR